MQMLFPCMQSKWFCAVKKYARQTIAEKHILEHIVPFVTQKEHVSFGVLIERICALASEINKAHEIDTRLCKAGTVINADGTKKPFHELRVYRKGRKFLTITEPIPE